MGAGQCLRHKLRLHRTPSLKEVQNFDTKKGQHNWKLRQKLFDKINTNYTQLCYHDITEPVLSLCSLIYPQWPLWPLLANIQLSPRLIGHTTERIVSHQSRELRVHLSTKNTCGSTVCDRCTHTHKVCTYVHNSKCNGIISVSEVNELRQTALIVF